MTSAEAARAPSSAVDDARLATFPLHEILLGPACGCGNPKCPTIGKHPAFAYSELEAGEQLGAGPSGGYGIATGARSGVFVIDLDIRPDEGKDGIAALAELGTVPRTLTVGTPTGGLHLYFKNPEGLRVKTTGNVIAPGVDVRGEGGFVVGPGSPHRNGGTYEVLEDIEPADAPGWLLDLLEEAHAPRPVAASPSKVLEPAERTRRIAMARAYLETAPPSVEGDGGSKALLRACIRLVRMELPLDTCAALVEEVFNPRCEPPWSEKEILHKLDDAERSDVANAPFARGVAAEWFAPWVARTLETPDTTTNDGNAPPEPGDWRFEAKTDTGNARRFVRLHGDKLRHVFTWGRWLAWDGRRWFDGDQGAPLALTEDVCQDVRMLAGSDDEGGTKWARASEARGKRENMVALAKVDPRVRISHEALDRKPYLFNVANGTLDLTSGALRPHDPADLLRQVSPIVFDPAATCPTWTAFLARIFEGAPELVPYMQRAIGYSLTGDVSEQCLFFLVGGGSNGKSTLTGLVLKLLGDAGKLLDRSVIMAKRDDGHPAGIAALVGARVAVCPELPKGKAFDEAALKLLSGGDRITAHGMRENWWEFNPTWKLWLHANDKPIVRGSDHGIWRRFRLIPVSVTIAEHEKDPRLPEKLEAELPGILNWALAGCLEWQRAGLQTPAIVTSAVAAYRKDMDVVGEFLDEKCVLEPAAVVSRTELYRTFTRWWEEQSKTLPINAKDFTGRLRDRAELQEKKVQGERQWVGVKVRPATVTFAGMQR